MTTSIRSDADKSVIVVNGVDALKIFPDGSIQAGVGYPLSQRVLFPGSPANKTFDDVMAPSWAKKATVLMQQINTNGTSPLLLQIGGNGGMTTTGYGATGTSTGGTSAALNSSIGFPIGTASNASSQHSGAIEILWAGGGTWVCSGSVADPGNSFSRSAQGFVLAPTVLERVRLTTINGTDKIISGSWAVLFEG